MYTQYSRNDEGVQAFPRCKISIIYSPTKPGQESVIFQFETFSMRTKY